jgi:hypothetical protein
MSTCATRSLVAGLTLLAALSGCKNDCQQLCHEMADYAADECGKEWSKDQLKSCMDDEKEAVKANAAREDVCADIAPTLREEWSCDDIDAYFD